MGMDETNSPWPDEGKKTKAQKRKPTRVETAPRLDLVPTTTDPWGDLADEQKAALQKALEIPAEELGDFVTAVRIITWRIEQRCSLDDAAQAFGVTKYQLHGPYWQSHLTRAQEFVLRPLTLEIAAARSTVLGRWQEAIDGMFQIMKSSKNDMARVKAFEALAELYMQETQTSPEANAEQRKFLNAPRNFNPMAVLQVQAGGQVVINSKGNDENDIVIEAEKSE
jgi:hypothetical protein